MDYSDVVALVSNGAIRKLLLRLKREKMAISDEQTKKAVKRVAETIERVFPDRGLIKKALKEVLRCERQDVLALLPSEIRDVVARIIGNDGGKRALP